MPRLGALAAVAAISLPATLASVQCDSVCQQVLDPSVIVSIGNTIESSIVSNGNLDIIRGSYQPGGWYTPSALWKIWASAFELAHGSQISHITASGDASDLVCIDKTVLAKLTAAMSNLHIQVTTSGQSGGSSINTSSMTIDHTGLNIGGNNMGTHEVHIGSSSGNSQEQVTVPDHPEESAATVNTGGSSSNNVHQVDTSSSSSTSSSTTSWGHGNVNSDICFKIKDKRSDRYLTTYGTEYAFAYYPNYYSVFRAHASKSVEGGYTLIEVNRSGSKVNYPVKQESLGQFKPLYGEKDAIFTFSPASFGDSCWGVPGKKMSRRHDWGGWGDNYRIGSSGEDCADVELEEADC